MTQNEKNGSRRINAILRMARNGADPSAREETAAFFRHYFSGMAPDDLAGKDARAAYEAARRHREFAAQRAPRQPLVTIENPQVRIAPYSVVSVVTDDMPFLVDSVRMELNRQGFIVHLMIHPVYAVVRTPQGALRSIRPPQSADAAAKYALESFIHVEIDRIVDATRMEELRQGLERVLDDVRKAVQDWQAMLGRVEEVIAGLDAAAAPAEPRAEAQRFLRWLTERNFTFLGHERYETERRDEGLVLREVPRSALGISRGRGRIAVEPLAAADGKRRGGKPALADILLIRKSVRRSTVHRPGYLDYISVRRFDARGRIAGEDRFLGLYTSMAYRRHPHEVPIVGRKIEAVVAMAKFDPVSHRGKAFQHILETYPRDELFQISERDLYATALGILHLENRQKLRLFVREDPLRCFVSCLIYIPRDLFDTDLRLKISALISARFKAVDLAFSVRLTDESFARIEYFLRVRPDDFPAYDAARIERELQEISWSWKDRFRNVLLEKVPEELSSRYLEAYAQAFPAAYREDYDPAEAFDDAMILGRLSAEDSLKVNLYVAVRKETPQLRLKLYHYERPIPPSDSLPILENMGVRVLQERPYRIVSAALSVPCWIYDYELQHQADVTQLDSFKPVFEQIFAGSWRGEIESDGFNALALSAGLSAREITVLRACCKYLLQAALPFSQAYIEQCVRKHPAIARSLLRLFVQRFGLDIADDARARQCESLQREIEQALDAVTSLDEDRILRNFLGLMLATVRTNFFQSEDAGQSRPLAFKFDPARVPELPDPRPAFEIFVYSPRVEGVHLRMGKVARGGLRWSDRREDFRTEILGLVKAQRVKNAVIVPTGAKGGFVVKRPPAGAGRDAVLQEAVACYRQFVGALLDLTDNLVEGRAAPPERVVRYDGDDTYLVVAADKGTAAFSDYANEVARGRGFWLDDAFASGGSQGYDHKKMGITARGAWESVKLHFRDLGRNIQTETFTVAGIGDMSGDVFGNGMLLSNRIRLVAAFNHMHVFLDPDPDPEKSFRERARLFALPRSTWEDYDAALLSPGGGIYLRSAKSIELTPQVQALLDTNRRKVAPNELVQLILKAPVDLLWNGGIGTYVKASVEQHADAGDRGNDALRVNGGELRCKVVGEGGNLGMTQRARVEYAMNGGRADADFIHNAGGVNCSDHEVNIKILLDILVRAKRLTREQRRKLLADMTGEVAGLVLQSNYWQAQAITLVEAEAYALIDEHARYIRHLEAGGQLSRRLEALPDDDQLAERKAAGRGLTRPEIAVLVSYSKMIAEAELVESDLWEDPYYAAELLRYFPTPLRAQYESFIHKHPLRAEILSMFIVNRMVNRMGFSFAFRMQEESGAALPEVVRAYTIAWEVFNLRAVWSEIAALDNRVPAAVQIRMMLEAVELINRASRWLIYNRRRMLGVRGAIIDYGKGAQALAEWLPGMLERSQDGFISRSLAGYLEQGVARPLALRVLSMDALYCTFDIVDLGKRAELPLGAVMETYFMLSAYLDIFWLRVRMQEYKVNSHWEDLARQAAIDDLYQVLAALTREVLKAGGRNASAQERIADWHELNKGAVERSRRIMVDMKAVEHPDLAMFAVSLRELQNLERASAANAQ